MVTACATRTSVCVYLHGLELLATLKSTAVQHHSETAVATESVRPPETLLDYSNARVKKDFVGTLVTLLVPDVRTTVMGEVFVLARHAIASLDMKDPTVLNCQRLALKIVLEMGIVFQF